MISSGIDKFRGVEFPFRFRTCWLVFGLVTSLSAGWCSPATAQSQIDSRPAASSPTAERLPPLAREVAVQIEIAYRYNAQEHKRRRGQLAAAIAAWRAASRSAANDQLLNEWLREAIRKSMPGSREPLPSLPHFDRPPQTATTETRAATTRQKPVVNDGGSSTGERKMNDLPGTEAESVIPSGPRVGAGTSEATVDDFWTGHPSNGSLPANLSGGDPFQDDPTAGE